MAQTAVYTPPRGLRTALDAFRDHVNQKYKIPLATYPELHDFSVNRQNDFWMTLWEYMRVIASVQPEKAVDESIPIDQFPQFYEGSKLNFSENYLCRWQHGPAVVNLGEENLQSPETYTWEDLRCLVRQYASALKAYGVTKGDTVALVGSNCVRSLCLMLATGAIGAIFSSFATDIGEKALGDRLEVLQPRLLFAETSYSYNGKKNSIAKKIARAFAKVNHDDRTLVVIGPPVTSSSALSFEKFLSRANGDALVYEQVAFSTPFVVMFSSGTTGAPKGIVHSHGGLLINGLKEHVLHHNVGPEDTYFHFSGIGWTLWNIAVSALLAGTTLVLYDGSPFFPSPEGFLRALFATGVTSFGAGPRYYSELQKFNVKPKQFAPLLHTVSSTGAVLPVPLAKWIAEAFGPVCQIGFSGGTELCGSFFHGTRSLPAYPGELTVKGLGMDVAVFAPDGMELPDGEAGELVCRKAFPNMPAKFLNDPDRKRYFGSYFEGFPHVWTHGDYVQVNAATKGVYVLGRSDGVLNPSGIRFASSDIYNILSSPKFTPAIQDACVVGQQRLKLSYSDPAERVVLFVKCTPAARNQNSILLRADLERDIKDQIAQDLSRRHVPSFIFQVPEIPYNANGKKLEIQVKAILNNGAEGLAKLKVTDEERRSLEWFLQFYHIEELVRRLNKPASKL